MTNFKTKKTLVFKILLRKASADGLKVNNEEKLLNMSNKRKTAKFTNTVSEHGEFARFIYKYVRQCVNANASLRGERECGWYTWTKRDLRLEVM